MTRAMRAEICLSRSMMTTRKDLLTVALSPPSPFNIGFVIGLPGPGRPPPQRGGGGAKGEGATDRWLALQSSNELPNRSTSFRSTSPAICHLMRVGLGRCVVDFCCCLPQCLPQFSDALLIE